MRRFFLLLLRGAGSFYESNGRLFLCVCMYEMGWWKKGTMRCLHSRPEENDDGKPNNKKKKSKAVIDKNPYKKNSSGKSAVAYLIVFRTLTTRHTLFNNVVSCLIKDFLVFLLALRTNCGKLGKNSLRKRFNGGTVRDNLSGYK